MPVTILQTIEQHTGELLRLAKARPQSAAFASYGLSLGIASFAGGGLRQWQDASREMFDLLAENGVAVRVLVGTGLKISCEDGICMACERQYVRQLIGLHGYVGRYPGFEWRVLERSHLKLSAFDINGDLVCITGGRNMTGSDWTDISLVLHGADASAVLGSLEQCWPLARPLTKATLASMCKEQSVTKALWHNAFVGEGIHAK